MITRIAQSDKDIKLSIMIMTLYGRQNFIERLLNVLRPQLTKQVQVLINIDNRQLTIGRKRNQLVQKSIGQYICFIDDDDLVSEDYVQLVLNGLHCKPDAIGMNLIMTTNGLNPQISCHSIRHQQWWQQPDPINPGKKLYYRNRNPLNPVKRQIAAQIKYPDINWGDDRVYAIKIKPYLKTQFYIQKPIYYYEFRTNK